jgi:hypothetical protein
MGRCYFLSSKESETFCGCSLIRVSIANKITVALIQRDQRFF